MERREGKVRTFTDRSKLRWVNFSACDASEKAYEQNGNGDFTRLATSLLASGIDITNREFQKRLMREFGATRRQTPQLDCPLNAEEIGLLRFVSDGKTGENNRNVDRRKTGERRGEESTPMAYDRRSGERRHLQTAAELRDLADRIESWSRA